MITSANTVDLYCASPLDEPTVYTVSAAPESPFVLSSEEVAYRNSVDECLTDTHSTYMLSQDEYLVTFSTTPSLAEHMCLFNASVSATTFDVFAVTDSLTPSSSRDVLRLPAEEQLEWIASEDAEWNQILKNAVTLVPRAGHHVLPTHNVYKTKADGTKKTRTCINGNLEHASNIRSTYAATTNEAIFRLFIALYHHYLALDPSWILASGDVSNAFCLAPIPEWN